MCVDCVFCLLVFSLRDHRLLLPFWPFLWCCLVCARRRCCTRALCRRCGAVSSAIRLCFDNEAVELAVCVASAFCHFVCLVVLLLCCRVAVACCLDIPRALCCLEDVVCRSARLGSSQKVVVPAVPHPPAVCIGVLLVLKKLFAAMLAGRSVARRPNRVPSWRSRAFSACSSSSCGS